MGIARIVSGGTDGRYTIELDYGSAQKTALLAALNEFMVRLDADILALQVKIDEANAKEQEQLLKVIDAQNDLILMAQSGLMAGSPELDTAAFQFELSALRDLEKSSVPIRLRMQSLEADKSIAMRRVSDWSRFEPLETRDAWCADLTEDAAPGSVVGTVDIPGESSLILIAPGCRAAEASDGRLTSREIMSPAQAFFNAAILPGWQKFQPTYRWGTITALDFEANTANVSLFPSVSSAQNLGVNQEGALSSVPVDYLTCNAKAFEVGDRCVVQFAAQDWSAPKIIGFLDNPKPCTNWPNVAVRYEWENFNITPNSARSWIYYTTAGSIACGQETQLGAYSGSAITANSASHKMFLHSTSFFGGSLPIATINSSIPDGSIALAETSTAYQFSASKVPYTNNGSWVSLQYVGGIISVIKATAIASDQTHTTLTSFCTVQNSFTGGMWSSPDGRQVTFSSELIAVGVAFEEWLSATSQLPEISVTYDGVTQPYRPVGLGAFSSGIPGVSNANWRLIYEADL
jgi:hypothetical protein